MYMDIYGSRTIIVQNNEGEGNLRLEPNNKASSKVLHAHLVILSEST
jgi:hypothetical protein